MEKVLTASHEPNVLQTENINQRLQEIDIDDSEGVLAQVETSDRSGLKLAGDHHTVLLPQPSANPNDPLNWSWTKKHFLLAAICLGSFQCDFTGVLTPAVVVQGAYWDMDPNVVNQATTLNVLMLGVAGFLWIPLSQWWGRAPVLFWTSILGFAFSVGCAVAQDFTQFYILRAFQGIFQSAYLSIGLTVIQDVFFLHEHARKIGIWILSVLFAPQLGPMIGNFMLFYLNDWRANAWVVAAVAGLNLALMPILADETHYNRTLREQPVRGTKISRLLGIWQIRNHSYFMSLTGSLLLIIKVCLKPLVILSFIYFLLAYMWFIGTAITAPILLQLPPQAGGYGFSTKSIGFMYFAPLIGITFGEIFGHFFNDWLANFYTRRHKGVYAPEARLPANVVAAVAMIPGLILLGFTLHSHLHWIGIAFGWGLYCWGACVASVAIYAYLADSYPNATGECSAVLNLGRCLGGFCVGYFELPWGLRDGYDVSFGVKAALVGASLVFIGLFKFYGKTIRKWGAAL